jgi:hypothetical protein
MSAHTQQKPASAPNRVKEGVSEGGQFATALAAESEMTLGQRPLSDAAVEEARLVHINEMCEEAGYAGVMPGIYELLLDRASDDDESVMPGALEELEASEVTDGFDQYVDEAITSSHARIISTVTPVPESDRAAVEEHITAISGEAGYPGVLPGYIEAILARDEHSDEILAFAKGLTADDLDTMYNEDLGPAIDDLQDDILENACTKCGASTRDGEGYDGLCGNCADAASCPECAGELDDDGTCDDCAQDVDSEDE